LWDALTPFLRQSTNPFTLVFPGTALTLMIIIIIVVKVFDA